jgi:hypothetical protein
MAAKHTASQLLEAKGLQYINAQKLFPINTYSRGSERGKILYEHSNQITNFPSIIIAIE